MALRIAEFLKGKKFPISEISHVHEYPLANPELQGSIATIKGRYPKSGYVVNKVVTELAFVLKGKGRIVVNGEEWSFQQNDQVFIYPGEKYYWEGEMSLFLVCSPAWTPDQYQEIPD